MTQNNPTILEVEPLKSEMDRTMAATRILNAPRDLVWEVLTDPDHIKNWWGPNGFSLTTHKHEMRTGGQWNFIMHGPDGTDFQNRMVFDELVPKERIVYSHGPTPRFKMFIQLFDLGDKTELRWKNIFENDQEFKQAVEVYHAVEGLDQNLGRLSGYLKSL
jgi:uncharacterized protein YndB with AHSA1/START domain